MNWVTVGLRCLLAASAALIPCAGVVTHADPEQPSTIMLKYGYAKGDDYSVLRRVAQLSSTHTLVDGGEPVDEQTDLVDTFRYRQLVEGVEPTGHCSAVTRTYQAATSRVRHDGRVPNTAIRALSGRRFRITHTGEQPVSIVGASVPGADRSELEDALSDEFAGLLPGGPCSVGDSWALPDNAASAFYIGAHAKGTCRLEGLVTHDRMPCAKISFVGSVDGLDKMGRRTHIALGGWLLWSTVNHRAAEFRMEVHMTSNFTTMKGATKTEESTDVAATITMSLTWHAVAGRRVPTPKG